MQRVVHRCAAVRRVRARTINSDEQKLMDIRGKKFRRHRRRGSDRLAHRRPSPPGGCARDRRSTTTSCAAAARTCADALQGPARQDLRRRRRHHADRHPRVGARRRRRRVPPRRAVAAAVPRYPRSAFDVNVRGTFNVMEACVKKGVKRLVYSSSASVYGDAVQEPMDEDHPFNNKNFYGATKIAGEAMLRAFHHRYGLHFVGLRYMNVYGPRQDYHGAYIAVIMKMLDAIDRGEGPTILGDGSEAFDFVAVEDCGAANVCAMKADSRRPLLQRRHRQAHVAQGARRDAARAHRLRRSRSSTPRAARRRWCATASAPRSERREEIGFTAQIDLREGLQRLIDWRRTTRRKSKRAAAPWACLHERASTTNRTIHISLPATGEDEWQACREPLTSGLADAGPEGGGVREGVRRAPPGRSMRWRSRAAPRACTCPRGDGDRPGRRGDRARVHVGRHGQRGALLRRDAGVRGRRPRDTYNIDRGRRGEAG